MSPLAKTGRKCPPNPRERILPRRLGLVCLLFATALALSPRAAACTELSSGTSFWVRLTAPVSSYTAKPGDSVKGFLLESPECENSAILPIKIPVEGQVVAAHRVGLGLWHETAALEIEFQRILPEGAPAIPIQGRVEAVDNARESVKNGVIHGIRGTDTPQGRISSRLKYLPSLHLYPDPFLLGYKMLFPVFPEPEITLEPGTDLQVELTQKAAVPPDLPAVAPVPAIDHASELAGDLTGLPERTFTRKGKEADVVNLVFAGSREQLEQAFQVAGWRQSEGVSKRAVVRQFYAFLAKTNYATAPISAQLLEGRTPDLTLEKTFDSYERRNHVRIWSLETSWEGEPLWASAAVHETGATLSIRHKGFMHHVSSDLEGEQRLIVRDLLAGGCVDSVGAIARPEMDHVLQNATGEFFRTDGTLTVVRLKPCGSDAHGAGFSDAPRAKPGSRPFRFARREILTVRSDLWRANCIYALFDLTRITAKAWRANSSHRAEVAAFHQGSHPLPVEAIPTAREAGPATEGFGP